MTQATDSAASTLLRLANGYQISQALYVAAELKVADLVGDTPVAAEDIAARVGAHPGSLYRCQASGPPVGHTSGYRPLQGGRSSHRQRRSL